MDGRIEPEPKAPRPERGLTSPQEPEGPAASDRTCEAVVRLCDAGLQRGLDDLQERLDFLLEQGPSTLVVDMSDVGHVSSTTVTALLWVRRRCSERSVHMVLRPPPHRSFNRLVRIGLLDAELVPTASWDPARTIIRGGL